MKYFIGGGHAANMANTLSFLVQQALLQNFEAMAHSFTGSVNNFASSKLLRKNSAGALTLWNLGFVALRGLEADQSSKPSSVDETRDAMRILSSRLGINFEDDYRMLTGGTVDETSR